MGKGRKRNFTASRLTAGTQEKKPVSDLLQISGTQDSAGEASTIDSGGGGQAWPGGETGVFFSITMNGSGFPHPGI